MITKLVGINFFEEIFRPHPWAPCPACINEEAHFNFVPQFLYLFLPALPIIFFIFLILSVKTPQLVF